ncbi:5'-adenylylsulfate reductase 3, chloroplastic [Quillaja saponaria]|uniref:5'-adenylylsulfate reductase 3, chloroplastic n=1 Tax=Quillaja saponaria TaxID=32244 RepID=A0AAD7QGY2_QUISA|nr:5'-adenylylsulfate reductase 3, chloroplastic [Quillaja saponaria]KAJ7981287.1 5'-adenylylsulfate reductase 3, chloroplastic [Quillaja saponaria]
MQILLWWQHWLLFLEMNIADSSENKLPKDIRSAFTQEDSIENKVVVVAFRDIQSLDDLEKHCIVHIGYMLLNITEVDQALVRQLSLYENVLQECYKVRQMMLLMTIFNSFQAANVPVNSLHSHEYVEVGCEPCTRLVSINVWFLIYNEYTKQKVSPIYDHKSGSAYGSTYYQCLVSLVMICIGHFFLFYASWCCFCQAMAGSCAERAQKLEARELKVEKFIVYEHKSYAKHKVLEAWDLGASSCTTPSFPRDCSIPIMKCSTENRDTGSSMAFHKAIK